MGIDWERVRVPAHADIDRIATLIEQQALACQSMWGLWGWCPYACQDDASVLFELQAHLHRRAQRAASDALAELLDFPGWDEERLEATDLPDLDPCWRVYPITNNPSFPLLWRAQACRTYLPDQWRARLVQWKAWAEQVALGEHEPYVRELHLFATTDFMKYHWTVLREDVEHAIERSETERWPQRHALADLGAEILRSQQPMVRPVRVDPFQDSPIRLMASTPDPRELASAYEAAFTELRSLLDRTHAWNQLVPNDCRVNYDEKSYDLSLESFRNHVRDPWLQDFFRWGERCAEGGFALYLSV